jgi:hypothetical protein
MNKVKIALGYYKKMLTEKVIRLNDIEEIEQDTFVSHITHTDLNRMLKEKHIDKETYTYLFNHLSIK